MLRSTIHLTTCRGRRILVIYYVKINNNTSSLETFEDQNNYLLG